jgi:hypothetical protein
MPPSVGWRPCHVLRTGGAVLACCPRARPAAILRQIKAQSCQLHKVSPLQPIAHVALQVLHAWDSRQQD